MQRGQWRADVFTLDSSAEKLLLTLVLNSYSIYIYHLKWVFIILFLERHFQRGFHTVSGQSVLDKEKTDAVSCYGYCWFSLFYSSINLMVSIGTDVPYCRWGLSASTIRTQYFILKSILYGTTHLILI